MSDKENNENIFKDLKPDIQNSSDSDIVSFSLAAIEKIKNIIAENKVGDEFFLRIGLRGGGTEGTEFFIEFDSEIRNNDRTFNLDGIQIIIDSRSLFFLIGYSINYSDEGFILSEIKKIV